MMIATLIMLLLLSGAGPQAAGASAGTASPATAQKPAAASVETPTRSHADQAALLEGKIPDGPERTLLRAKCLICHSTDYVTQQRLTIGQWQKTVEKMKRWGAPISDDEMKILVAWLARTWTTDLPERRSALRPAPR